MRIFVQVPRNFEDPGFGGLEKVTCRWGVTYMDMVQDWGTMLRQKS